MVCSPTDFRKILPEVIWLEPEQFEQAKQISTQRSAGAFSGCCFEQAQARDETRQWQTYLNALALLGFESWLRERNPELSIKRDNCSLFQPQYASLTEAVCNLKVGEFNLCLIALDSIIEPVVRIPRAALDSPELIAHFYVVLEVVEEEGKIIMRGFLRYDELERYLQTGNLQTDKHGYYPLSLSLFEPEVNRLLFYSRFLKPSAIPQPYREQIPAGSTQAGAPLLELVEETRTQLSQWLQGVFDQSWQTIETLVNPENQLAWRTRDALKVQAGKLINLGMQLGSQTVVLLMIIKPEADEKVKILVDLQPTNPEKYLPPNVKLTLLSKTGEILQKTQSRSLDNLIGLKSFKGKPGTRFSIQVSLNDVSFQEDFEI